MSTMPLFVLKAKDLLTLPTIRHYRSLCRDYGLHSQAAEVDLAIREMAAWAEVNPTQMQAPDHKHVPAEGGT